MVGALVVGVAGFSSLLLTTFGMWVTVSPDNNYSHKFFCHSRNLFSKNSFWGEGGAFLLELLAQLLGDRFSNVYIVELITFVTILWPINCTRDQL